MHKRNIEAAFADLFAWCRRHDFAGYDPFDGLNSRLFQTSPFRNSRAARLLWTQLSKRSPVNLRLLARVRPERNAKGIALFALAAIARYRTLGTKEAEVEARALLNDLMAMRLKGFKGAAWGYNFDWQGRAFFAPRGTPTLVPTAFAARALIEGAEAFGAEEYLACARTVCDFILNDLNRSAATSDEVCFSYSPLDHTRVFNASLLAGETLASLSRPGGQLSYEPSLSEWALRAARYVVRRQQADGSWAYGGDDYQTWSDNFHTAFILSSLSRIIKAVPICREEFEPSLRRGYEYWRERFFLAHGWPKYYPDRLYPADAHSSAAAMVTLADLSYLDDEAVELARKIADWALGNLRSPEGYFYYQRRRWYTNRIPYMRWSEAWMAYGLARLLELIH
jgi:hypothetical protein